MLYSCGNKANYSRKALFKCHLLMSSPSVLCYPHIQPHSHNNVFMSKTWKKLCKSILIPSWQKKKNELCVCDHLKKFAGGLCYCNISIWADAYFYHTWHAALARLGPWTLVFEVSVVADVTDWLADASQSSAADVTSRSHEHSLASWFDFLSWSHSLWPPVISTCEISLHLESAAVLVRALNLFLFSLSMF